MYRGVFQDWLDRIGAAVIEGDYPTYANAVSLPFLLVTENATISVDDDTTLQEGFVSYRKMLSTQGVTHMVRLSSGTTDLGPDLIVGNYTTHLLINARPALPPFVSSMTLRCEDGIWKATTIVNSLAATQWPVDVVKGAAQ